MTDELARQLTDFGALGLFAAFLLYQHFMMQKKVDTLIAQFQTQIDDIRDHCIQQEDKLRDRYDAVVAKYDAETQALREGLLKTIEEVARKLDMLLNKMS